MTVLFSAFPSQLLHLLDLVVSRGGGLRWWWWGGLSSQCCLCVSSQPHLISAEKLVFFSASPHPLSVSFQKAEKNAWQWLLWDLVAMQHRDFPLVCLLQCDTVGVGCSLGILQDMANS